MSNYTPYIYSIKKLKMKETMKNKEENDQISAILGISRQIKEKKICKVYTSIYIYISGKTVLSAFHYFYENILYTSEVITDSHITFIGKFFIISCLI